MAPSYILYSFKRALMKKTSFVQPKTLLAWAICASLLSSLSYTIMLTFAKFSLEFCTTNQLAFFRSLISFFLTVGVTAFSSQKGSYISFLKTTEINIHLIRCSSALIAVYLYMYSIKNISITEGSLLFNTSPFFIPFIAYFWKKSPIDVKIWPGIFTAFLGLALLAHPSNSYYTPSFWIALLAGIMGAVSVVALRFSHYSEPLFRSLFYYGVFSTIVTGIICSPEGLNLSSVLQTKALLPILVVGITGFSYQVLIAVAIKYAPAKQIGPFFYISVIFGTIFDLMFWQKTLKPVEILGIFLIIAGLFLMIFLVKSKKTDKISFSE